MSIAIQQLVNGVKNNEHKSLSRSISLVENKHKRAKDLLEALDPSADVPVIGITGPPGAGKSSLLNELIAHCSSKGEKIAILAVDPSSPFNLGAILGDRIRLKEHFANPNIYIRSIASRGSLGGLSARTLEISDILRAAGFDWIFIETIGVGQSEIEIAALADCCVLVLVPESGDEIQTMKAGILEIADIIVVNKSDRPDADSFAANLEMMLHQRATGSPEIKLLKTSAIKPEGIDKLVDAITGQLARSAPKEKRLALLTRKALTIIAEEKMKTVDEQMLRHDLQMALQKKADFSLYRFMASWLKNKH